MRVAPWVAGMLALPALLFAQDTTRREPQKLQTVTVEEKADFTSARLVGFDRRRLRKQGTVSYFLGEDITKRGTIRVSDALRRAPGVRVLESTELGNSMKLIASSRTQLPSGGGFLVRGPPRRAGRVETGGGGGGDAALVPCIMQVAVDGFVKERGFSVDEISVTEVYGIEVYPAASSLPAEFGSIKPDGWCGMVMIWTRSR
ncbi:MAG: hypothetical protein AB1762_00205 [Gemmatimonadota bacterium]